MTVRLIDFAFSRPSPSAIAAAGNTGVIRYLSSDATKAISPGEAASYHRSGLTVTLVYEDAANDAEGGAPAGAAKAAIARPQLDKLGVPAGRPVYFAVDENLAPSKYAEACACITTFARDLARPPACYGPRPFLAFGKANGFVYLYESNAAQWSTGPEPPAFAPTILEGLDQVTFGQPPRVANASGHAVIEIEGATPGVRVTVRLAAAI